MIWKKWRVTAILPGLQSHQIDTQDPGKVRSFVCDHLSRCERIQIDRIETAMNTEDRRDVKLWGFF